jgi:hypothetical protein
MNGSRFTAWHGAGARRLRFSETRSRPRNHVRSRSGPAGLNRGRSCFTRLRRGWRCLCCDRYRLNNFDTRHRLRRGWLGDRFADRSFSDRLGDGRSFWPGLFDNGSRSFVFFNHGSEKFTLLGNDRLGDFNGTFKLDKDRVFDCSFGGFPAE